MNTPMKQIEWQDKGTVACAWVGRTYYEATKEASDFLENSEPGAINFPISGGILTFDKPAAEGEAMKSIAHARLSFPSFEATKDACQKHYEVSQETE